MKKYLLFGVLLALMLCSACRIGKPAMNITQETGTLVNAPLSIEDVRKAIEVACLGRTWLPKEIKPGLIQARLVVRGKHTVIVEIPYSAETYSINYKDSSNMEYNPEKGKIHPNYNKWVSLLQTDINTNIAKARAGK